MWLRVGFEPSTAARAFRSFRAHPPTPEVPSATTPAAPACRYRTQEVGVRAGMSMTLVAPGAIAGPPVSGAINGATGGFVFTGVFAGGLFLMSDSFGRKWVADETCLQERR